MSICQVCLCPQPPTRLLFGMSHCADTHSVCLCVCVSLFLSLSLSQEQQHKQLCKVQRIKNLMIGFLETS